MKICPECKAENNTDDAQYCNKCGTILAEVNNSPAINNPAIDDDLEFEITETAESDAPQLFGSSSSKDKKDEEESLEIRDNSNLLGDDQIMVPSESEVPTDKLSVDNNISQEPQTPDSPTPDESQQSDQFSVDWSSSPKTEKPTPPQNPN
ncbi:MAG: hypothetical protein GY865_06195, partial [candidate division Zixibacteria bacterium]|nr:hypothetical protein [candidate division Zixibacteria bacterium]